MSVLAWLLPWSLLGWSVLGATVGRPRGADLAFALIPCVALGAGLSGLLHYVLLATIAHPLPGAELVLAVAIALIAFRRPALPPLRVKRGRLAGLALLGLALTLCAFALTSVAFFGHHPEGDFDAWDFWVMRARMLVRLGEDWGDAYSPFLTGAHSLYPPLWSMTIARAWTLSSDEARSTPWLIGMVYGLGAVSLVGWAVARARGIVAGLLASLTLASIPYFASHSSSQYADVPLSFFLLGTVATVALFEVESRRGWLILAGLLAGLAALTKNEGSLFVLVFLLALAMVRWPRFDRVAFGAFALGALPSALTLFHFRAFIAPDHGGTSEDFTPEWDEGITGSLTYASERVVEPERWTELYEGLLPELWFDGGLVPILVALPVLLVVAGWSSRPAPRALQAAGLALVLYVVALGLSLVMLSLWSVRDHVTELDRLFLVVTPVAIFAAFAGAWPKRVDT